MKAWSSSPNPKPRDSGRVAACYMVTSFRTAKLLPRAWDPWREGQRATPTQVRLSASEAEMVALLKALWSEL